MTKVHEPPCTFTPAIVTLVADIAEAVGQLSVRLESARDLRLRRINRIRTIHGSLAIEGNTLTLRETAELIEHGITVGGKPLRDHLEAADHYDALLWMRDQAAAAGTAAAIKPEAVTP